MEHSKRKTLALDYYHTRIVIDTSVLLKHFINEDGSDTVDELVQLHLEKQLVLMAPPLLVFEFLNTIVRNMNNFDMAKNAHKRFQAIGLAIISPEDRYVNEAIYNMLMAPQVSYYDASYHALAKDMDAVFLTADKKYYDLMRDQGNIELFKP